MLRCTATTAYYRLLLLLLLLLLLPAILLLSSGCCGLVQNGMARWWCAGSPVHHPKIVTIKVSVEESFTSYSIRAIAIAPASIVCTMNIIHAKSGARMTEFVPSGAIYAYIYLVESSLRLHMGGLCIEQSFAMHSAPLQRLYNEINMPIHLLLSRIFLDQKFLNRHTVCIICN